ncbi:DUF397 domain-containing protein [Nocardia rhamnosiphila]
MVRVGIPRGDAASTQGVEVIDLSRAKWFKSTKSGGGRDCVETAHVDHGMVAVRDSKNPHGPVLILDPGQWDAFLDAAKSGRFDQQ